MTETTTGYNPTDRRPIAARNLAIMERAANALAARGITPNQISVAGAGFAALAGICFSLTPSFNSLQPLFWILGAVFVQARLLANLFDGMVAIKQGIASPVGELYNEVPDRISDSFILIGLGYSFGGSPELGYLAALFAVGTAYIRAVGKGLTGRQDFCGPMAKQQRMFIVTVTALFCAFSSAYLKAPTFALAIIALASLGTAVRRLLRIAEALRA